jgi:hypothetical protein
MKMKWMVGIFFMVAIVGMGFVLPVCVMGQEEELPSLGLPDMEELGPPPGPQEPGRPGRPDMIPGTPRRPLGDRPQADIRNRRRHLMMEKLKTEDPERYGRLVKIRELAEEYRNTDSEKRKEEIEKELRPLVDKELKIQQDRARKKVEELEKKLKNFEKILKEREQNWDEVVDHNIKKITGQKDYLDFPPVPMK